MRQSLLVMAFVAAAFLIPSIASAQSNTIARPSVPRPTTDRLIQQNQGYKNVYQRRPSVSPYLNLLNNNTSDVTNYQSLVRPMVNQNRINAQQSAQISRLQAKPPTSSNAGSESLRSTGHQSTYQYYSHFYPNLK